VNHNVVRFALAAATLAMPTGARAHPPAEATVIVGVQIDPSLERGIVTHGLDEAVRLYRRDGLSIRWTESSESTGQIHLRLIVLRRDVVSARKRNTSLGLAPREAARTGRLAYVFFDPIEKLALREGVDISQVLGAAIAHELGHLLMPNQGHASEGLMRGAWGAPEARAADKGALKFSKPELAAMRRQLTPESVATAGSDREERALRPSGAMRRLPQ
jgi:hypothetical protein